MKLLNTCLTSLACLLGAHLAPVTHAAAAASGSTIIDSGPAAIRYWDLPTGSRIAYVKFPAVGPKREHPIVFLHGGPGAYAVTIGQTTSVLSELSKGGFDVYVYDQVGGGMSERLTDITEYTVARHVADLESIRRQIDAGKMVLIGSSWGATLAGRYIARYPAHVGRVIFAGPGVLHPADWARGGYGRIEERFTAQEMKQFQALVNQPQLEAAIELLPSDPAAALRAFPDADADHLFDEATRRFFLSHLGCEGITYPFTLQGGYGFWSNRMTGRDLDRSETPLPALRRARMPALILRGECEYMDRAVAGQYRDVFAGSVLIDVPEAGHMIYWDQPAAFLDKVRRFLGD